MHNAAVAMLLKGWLTEAVKRMGERTECLIELLCGPDRRWWTFQFIRIVASSTPNRLLASDLSANSIAKRLDPGYTLNHRGRPKLKSENGDKGGCHLVISGGFCSANKSDRANVKQHNKTTRGKRGS